MKVLIVDDEAAYRRELSEIVEAAGHVARAVPGLSSRDFDELLLDSDVLVVDLMLREPLGGLGLVRYLRERAPRKPMVLISGFPYAEPLASTRTADRVFLAKPFRGSELLAAVERVARIGRA